jgi:hypothetical protein
MAVMTPEIRQAIENAGDQPVELRDPETNVLYVVVRAEVYERLRLVNDDLDIREAYPMINQVAAHEGWDDPSMAVYDECQSPPE